MTVKQIVCLLFVLSTFEMFHRFYLYSTLTLLLSFLKCFLNKAVVVVVDNASSWILEQMELMKGFVRETREKRITIINTGGCE